MSGDRGNLRYRSFSVQKPAKRRRRRRKVDADRDRIDLVELHTRLTESGRQRKASRATWIGAALFLMAVPSFFIMGCFIATLPVSVGMKVLVTIPVGILGFILSYIVATLLR